MSYFEHERSQCSMQMYEFIFNLQRKTDNKLLINACLLVFFVEFYILNFLVLIRREMIFIELSKGGIRETVRLFSTYIKNIFSVLEKGIKFIK